VVKKAFRNGGYGNYILIDHGNGYTTSFSHMKKYLVSKGDKVQRGQLIGLVGNSGRSTGPHLHYEIALDNKTINPYNFLQVASLSKVPTLRRRLKK
jgi:murein DD-endopeptidase MepM/ murein hydrolase activator NlpD